MDSKTKTIPTQTRELATLRGAEPSPPAPPSGGRELATRPLWHVLPRLTSYGIVLFIVWVILAVMFPAIFSRSSERAVIDSPVTLITTPVEGIVTEQKAPVGTPFTPGQTLMALQNPNLDRALLTELTGKQLDNQQRYEAATTRLEADRARLATTEEDIKRYQAAAQREHDARIKGLEARLSAAHEQIDQQEDIVNRNQAMQWAGAVSQAYTDASRNQLAVLNSSRDAIRADLENAQNSRDAARGKVYLSSTDGSVSELAQRRDELKTEIQQLQAELDQLQEYGRQVDQLVAAERSRLDRLSNLEIKANDTGVVQDVLAPPGTRVAAGATLMRATNCGQPRVVAVFPRSLSNDLLPGTRVSVQVDGVPGRLSGSVAEVLPRAPDGDQARYFVPFPPIEKNEIYLIARLDKPLPPSPTQGASPSDRCALGHWARVSLGKPWWNPVRTLL